MQQIYVLAQEAKRKDNIEQEFAMLQARFHILTSSCCLWECHAMQIVIQTCVILNNLVINFKCQNGVDSDHIINAMYVPQHPFVVVLPREGRQFLIPHCKWSWLCSRTWIFTLDFNMIWWCMDRWDKWYSSNNKDDNDKNKSVTMMENNPRSHKE
jgi:hypothetical protein